ncbi:MAG: hypothetical protein F6K42_11060 [Leptolyngbya sp. SIO1D8]|nr:hypothetical protein [Leptolyngbya sp. SIO1D8]
MVKVSITIPTLPIGIYLPPSQTPVIPQFVPGRLHSIEKRRELRPDSAQIEEKP